MSEATPTPEATPAPAATVTTIEDFSGQLLHTIEVGAEAGWTTTEFWRSLAVEAIGLLTLLGVIHPAPDSVNTIVGMVTMVGPGIAYTLGRSIRKSGTPG